MNVLATAHELFVQSEQNRVVHLRTTLREMDHDPLCMGAPCGAGDSSVQKLPDRVQQGKSAAVIGARSRK